jgi:hypothetical protein
MSTATDLSTAKAALRGAWSPRRWDIALFGTPILLLVNVRDDRVLLAAVAIATAVAFVRRGVRESPWFWIGLAVLVGARQTGYFLTLDDHIVVTTYWCGAVGLALLATDRDRVIVRSAGLLVGLVFAFAAMWKLTSGQFIDERFFRFTLIWDARFEHIGRFSDQPDPQSSRDALATLLVADETGGATTWREGARSELVATLMTWWGVFIEAAVAVTFLLPLRRRPWLRHVALFAFMIGTYLVVPITGFGCLLAIMAAVHTDDVRWRRAYVITFGVLLVVWPALWRVVTGYSP